MPGICIYCRNLIVKNSNFAYLCRDCEAIVRKAQKEERQVYLDSYV